MPNLDAPEHAKYVPLRDGGPYFTIQFVPGDLILQGSKFNVTV